MLRYLQFCVNLKHHLHENGQDTQHRLPGSVVVVLQSITQGLHHLGGQGTLYAPAELAQHRAHGHAPRPHHLCPVREPAIKGGLVVGLTILSEICKKDRCL